MSSSSARRSLGRRRGLPIPAFSTLPTRKTSTGLTDVPSIVLTERLMQSHPAHVNTGSVPRPLRTLFGVGGCSTLRWPSPPRPDNTSPATLPGGSTDPGILLSTTGDFPECGHSWLTRSRLSPLLCGPAEPGQMSEAASAERH